MNNNKKIVQVCSICLSACCWQGEIMCSDAIAAGTKILSVYELKNLKKEDESYWSDETDIKVYGKIAPYGFTHNRGN